MFTASAVACTSCTRIIMAPCHTANAANAILAGNRCSTGCPNTALIMDLRDTPTSRGNPNGGNTKQ